MQRDQHLTLGKDGLPTLVRQNNFAYLVSPKNAIADEGFRLRVSFYLGMWGIPAIIELGETLYKKYLEDNIFEKVATPWGYKERCHFFNTQRYRQQVTELLIDAPSK